MSKAPKKIWVWDYAADKLVNDNPDSTDIPYIRADLVDGLVEALEDLEQWVAGTGYEKARAAIAALKEEE